MNMIIRPINTSKIEDGIFAIRSFISNFYVLDTGTSLIAFDTGTNVLLSKNGMKKLGLNPDNISHVFLTHSDYDHVGGLSIFKNASVYISKAEEPMVTGKKARMLIKYNKQLDNYTMLNDRDTIQIGNLKIQIISSPGHTIGSACYLINDSILISGDLLRTSDKGRITPFLFFQNMNHSELKRSLSKLMEEGITKQASIILTGHTGILRR